MITSDFKRAFKHATWFAFFGPLFGLLIVLFAVFVSYLFSEPWKSTVSLGEGLSIASTIALYGVMVAYFIGFLPAFITGFASGFGSNKYAEIILAVSVGGASSFLMSTMVSVGDPLALYITIVGVLSAMACVKFCQYRGTNYLQEKTRAGIQKIHPAV